MHLSQPSSFDSGLSRWTPVPHSRLRSTEQRQIPTEVWNVEVVSEHSSHCSINATHLHCLQSCLQYLGNKSASGRVGDDEVNCTKGTGGGSLSQVDQQGVKEHLNALIRRVAVCNTSKSTPESTVSELSSCL